MNLMKNRIGLAGLAALAMGVVWLAPGLRAQAPEAVGTGSSRRGRCG